MNSKLLKRSVISRLSRLISEKAHSRFFTSVGLNQANQVPTHLTPTEKRKLFQLAEECNGCIVEIGSYVGASSCFLARGTLENNGHVYCVDTWRNDAMTEGERDTFSRFRANTQLFNSFITPLRGTSVEMAACFDKQIDLLFVDGDHSYSGVKADWDAWHPHLQNTATVVFHDIGWAEGVQRLVAEDVAPVAISAGRLPNLYWAKIHAENCRP